MEKREKASPRRGPIFEKTRIVASYDKKELEAVVRPHLPAPGPYA
jgi:hypothetical protein